MESPQYLLVINHLVANVVRAVEELHKIPKFQNLELLAITDRPDFEKKYAKYIGSDKVIHCDFNNSSEISAKLAPYLDNIAGVICRGDRHIQYLRRVAPLLPNSVLVASRDALAHSTNKLEMRTAFANNSPEITPKVSQVKNALQKSIDELEKKVGYPMVIKPANLFSSLLIQVCNNQNELKESLNKVFSQIQQLYNQRDIHEQPQVLAEEYLEGDFYSIDAYVMELGDIYFCPPVCYIPAKKIGIDDFFLYKRFIPTELNDAQVEQANETVRKALNAVALSHSSAHVEMVLTKTGWKIIEIGPRLGRFRHLMYEQGYGIDHSLNDVKIHLGIKPAVSNKPVNFCSAYSIYATKEGILKKIKGIEILENMAEVKNLKIYNQAGDKVHFAKHGGHAITEFVVVSDNKEKYEKVVEQIEKEVYAEID